MDKRNDGDHPARGTAEQPVIVVSGLPRSGTSLMMRMLAAGGVPLLTDGQRTADEDNPHGYFEYEPVKALQRDSAWLPQARGKAIKIISQLLPTLPPDVPYRVLFMRRELGEVLASQRQMLARRGKPADASGDAELAALFAAHLQQVQQWLGQQAYIATLDVSYNELLHTPQPLITQINTFLGGGLDTAQMAQMIDPQLYRQRGA